jgi:hypothetical protein
MDYVVKPGDSLSIIARDMLGDVNAWQYLASINAIPAPYTLQPGQVIKTDVAEVSTKKRGGLGWLLALLVAGGITYAVIKKRKSKRKKGN